MAERKHDAVRANAGRPRSGDGDLCYIQVGNQTGGARRGNCKVITTIGNFGGN
jgi:hypothetical protein